MATPETGRPRAGLDRLYATGHHGLMWVQVVAVVAIAGGVVGFVLGLGRTQRNDEPAPLLLVWAAVTWAGTATIIATEVA
jgi:hypothetical protein